MTTFKISEANEIKQNFKNPQIIPGNSLCGKKGCQLLVLGPRKCQFGCEAATLSLLSVC